MTHINSPQMRSLHARSQANLNLFKGRCFIRRVAFHRTTRERAMLGEPSEPLSRPKFFRIETHTCCTAVFKAARAFLKVANVTSHLDISLVASRNSREICVCEIGIPLYRSIEKMRRLVYSPMIQRESSAVPFYLSFSSRLPLLAALYALRKYTRGSGTAPRSNKEEA